MTDPIDHLISLGASSVAGKLMYRQTVLGHMKNGVFQITPEGERMLNVQEAVVVRTTKPVVIPNDVVETTVKPAAKKGKKVPAAEPAPAPAEAPAPVIRELDGLDKLLED